MPNSNTFAPQGFVLPHILADQPTVAPVLLALSGGSDSRALLHMLAACSMEYGFPLVLAHVNHGIRGEEALRDRDFCVSLAKLYGLEICVLNADVPALAKLHGRGLEEEARLVRYEYFEQLMRERNIPILATAHHADDNLETVLFHLCRGTGLTGLCGISSARPFGTGTLTRPLLRLTHREILNYCAEHVLEYVIDSTNADTAYTRNRIRAEVTPILEELFGTPQRHVTEMTEALREDAAILDALGARLLQSAQDAWGLSLAVLRKAENPIVKRALMQWVRNRTGQSIERVHLKELMRLVRDEKTYARAALPGGVDVIAEFGFLRLLPHGEPNVTAVRAPLKCGEILLLEQHLRITVKKERQLTKINNLSTLSYINLKLFFDIIKDSCYWRMRKEGDTILMGGMHRKLRKLYGEADIPPRWRDRIPLLCDADGIIWAPFVGMRDGWRNEGEEYLLSVELLPD